jgi:hypothetical protein
MFVGCEDVLNIQPTNMISEEAVKKDPVLVDAFLSKIYNAVRWQTGSGSEAIATISVCGGEHHVFAAWQTPSKAAFYITDENGAHNSLEYWPYDNVRSANEIIEILEEASFDPDVVEQKVAEARFLRAFMYFELVKRYGGVPIITRAQSIDEPIEDLYVPRDSEQDVYDFIAQEMDAIELVLPDQQEDVDYGRPTRWAALALKSRAMLYAGSIAKYGAVQLDGLLGIPAGEANTYYQKAYEAANTIITESHHQLYDEVDDPMQNYADLFTTDGNLEAIFVEVYNLSLLKTHGWNFFCMPDGFQTGWGSNNPVYLEMVEKYEYQDGSIGKLDWNQLDGNTWFDLDALMNQKDPRFKASVFYPETPWQGRKVYFHSSTTGSHPSDSDWPATAPKRNRIKSGFLARKRVNESILLPINKEDETDWMVFRLGEMYLNAAEAAFEQGDSDEAIRLVNIIRDRAEMPDKTTLSLDELRNERAVELAFEEHRYWDLRRWRIAVEELNGKGFHGVTWDYDGNLNQYSLKLKDGDYNLKRSFSERDYYFPMGLKRLANNSNFVENPGYTNPTPVE